MSSMERHVSLCVPSSRTSVGNVRVESDISGRILEIRTQECVLLRNTWNAIANRQDFGRLILLQVFRQKPALKNLFKLNSVTDTETLTEHPIFQKHSASFSMFLHVTLSRLLSREGAQMLMITHQVGKAHANFEKVNFDAEYWLLFKSAVLAQLEPHYTKGKLQLPLVREVWNRFLMFLIMEMKTAFNQQTVKRFSSSDLRRQVYWNLLDSYEDCDCTEDDEYVPSASLQRAVSDTPFYPTRLSTTCPLPRRNITLLNVDADRKACTPEHSSRSLHSQNVVIAPTNVVYDDGDVSPGCQPSKRHFVRRIMDGFMERKSTSFSSLVSRQSSCH